MPNLSDSQLMLLSAAAQRADRIVVPPPNAQEKLFKPLLKRGLLEEVLTVNGYPMFRRNRDGAPISLRITDQGQAAIGIEPDDSSNTEKQAADARQKQGAAWPGSRFAWASSMLPCDTIHSNIARLRRICCAGLQGWRTRHLLCGFDQTPRSAQRRRCSSHSLGASVLCRSPGISDEAKSQRHASCGDRFLVPKCPALTLGLQYCRQRP